MRVPSFGSEPLRAGTEKSKPRSESASASLGRQAKQKELEPLGLGETWGDLGRFGQAWLLAAQAGPRGSDTLWKATSKSLKCPGRGGADGHGLAPQLPGAVRHARGVVRVLGPQAPTLNFTRQHAKFTLTEAS